jgi:hypothetical protein
MSPMESKTSLRTSSEVSSLRLNKQYLLFYEGRKFKGSGVKRVYNINLSIILLEKINTTRSFSICLLKVTVPVNGDR